MIEIIEGFPDNVVGMVATGRVTVAECDSVLLPVVAEIRRRHDKLRLYFELDCRFPGAGWEDLDIAPLRLQPWERVALVTDVSWVRQTVKALRFLIPAEVQVFPTIRAEEGRKWVTAGLVAPDDADRPRPLATTTPTAPNLGQGYQWWRWGGRQQSQRR